MCLKLAKGYFVGAPGVSGINQETIRTLKAPNRWKTLNIQHRTPNIEVSEDSRCRSMFGVGCSMLDVPPGSWKAPGQFGWLLGRRSAARNILLVREGNGFQGKAIDAIWEVCGLDINKVQ